MAEGGRYGATGTTRSRTTIGRGGTFGRTTGRGGPRRGGFNSAGRGGPFGAFGRGPANRFGGAAGFTRR